MKWRVDPRREASPSRQIVEAALDALASGELAAGAKLPSVREMAAEALVNHNTAARAYRDLEQLGAVDGRNGLGVFVTSKGPRIARDLRRAETLEAFDRALAAALRAGHELGDLLGRAQANKRKSA
jgi:DNA-binding transcriptional regulator YhcF (GntR family)